MAIGFVLIFLGIQLNLVESYTLTPRFSNFLSAHTNRNQPQFVNNGNPLINPAVNPNGVVIPNPNGYANPNVGQNNSPFYQASFPNGAAPSQPVIQNYGPPKVVALPSWLCWPVLFLGTVVFLHGFSMRRSY